MRRFRSLLGIKPNLVLLLLGLLRVALQELFTQLTDETDTSLGLILTKCACAKVVFIDCGKFLILLFLFGCLMHGCVTMPLMDIHG